MSPRCVVAPNAFKHAASADACARALAVGLRDAWPDCVVDEMPVADGGTGTLEVLARAGAAARARVGSVDLAGDPIEAEVALLSDGSLVVESAIPCGTSQRAVGPMTATSRGVGLCILHGIKTFPMATRILLCLGGTRTVDGGVGMLQALGGHALDGSGRQVGPGGAGMCEVRTLRLEKAKQALRGLPLCGLCDVASPLLGPSGARLYMRQKGASDAMCDVLHAGLEALCGRGGGAPGAASADLQGAGAAGGIGFCVAELGGSLVPGAEAVLRRLHAEERIARANFVVTGEGTFDGQTSQGKAPYAVATMARALGVPVIMVCGRMRMVDRDATAASFDHVHALERADRSDEQARSETLTDLTEAGRTLARRMGSTWELRLGDAARVGH